MNPPVKEIACKMKKCLMYYCHSISSVTFFGFLKKKKIGSVNLKHSILNIHNSFQWQLFSLSERGNFFFFFMIFFFSMKWKKKSLDLPLHQLWIYQICLIDFRLYINFGYTKFAWLILDCDIWLLINSNVGTDQFVLVNQDLFSFLVILIVATVMIVKTPPLRGILARPTQPREQERLPSRSQCY